MMAQRERAGILLMNQSDSRTVEALLMNQSDPRTVEALLMNQSDSRTVEALLMPKLVHLGLEQMNLITHLHHGEIWTLIVIYKYKCAR